MYQDKKFRHRKELTILFFTKILLNDNFSIKNSFSFKMMGNNIKGLQFATKSFTDIFISLDFLFVKRIIKINLRASGNIKYFVTYSFVIFRKSLIVFPI